MRGMRQTNAVEMKADIVVCLVAGCLIVLAGCATTSMSEKAAEETAAQDEFFTKYEDAFQPSQYDASAAALEAMVTKNSEVTTGKPEPPDARVEETVGGFRIQVLATTEIDEAIALKSELSALMQVDTVYVTYSAPYYKVRVGDFHSRPEANQLLRYLTSSGYKDAWIVADQVLRNPPPKKTAPPPRTDSK
jgi:hypothetical protein